MVDAPARTGLTAAEYATLPETNQPTELIDGEVIVSPDPRDDHQKIVGRLYIQLMAIATTHLPDAAVRLAPLDVYLDAINAVQPDLFVVAGDNSRCVLREDGYWYGAPDLVIEVVSTAAGAMQRDKITKFRLYEKHGVREYWIVDPVNTYVEVFQLADGKYQLAGVHAANEKFTSAVLNNQTIDLSAVFA